MGTPAVGKDIESICGRCGDVWHVIVAKVGEQVAKVQCKECGGVHRYRPPRPVTEASASKTAPRRTSAQRASATERGLREARGAAPGRTPRVTHVDGPLVPIDPLKPLRTYRPTESFVVGDAIEHLRFGRGVVEALPEPGKIQVWFGGERKLLVHGRGQGAGGSAPDVLPARRPSGLE
jgi:hypothetical protein